MSDAQTGKRVIRCTACGRKLTVPAAATGRRVRCPGCGGTFVVPTEEAAPSSVPHSAAPGEPLRIHCASCGSKMKVAAKAIGRRVRCPRCSAVLTVPAPAATPDGVAADGAGPLDDGDSLLDELAAAERSAVALARPDLAAAPVALPRNGGFAPPGPTSASGAAAITARDVAGVAGAALGGVGRFVGSLVLGCVLAVVGAVIGAVAWTIVAIATEYQFGVIAWGVGGLTGFGMALGLRQISALGGIVAAALSLVSIVVAKFAIFMFVVFTIVTDVTATMQNQEATQVQEEGQVQQEAQVQPHLLGERIYVAGELTEEVLDEWNVTQRREREREWPNAWREALIRLERMSDEEVLAKYEQYRAEDEDWVEDDAEYAAEEQAEFDDDSAGAELAADEWRQEETDQEEYYDDAEDVSAGEFLGAFVRAVFHPLDLLFIVLAVLTAFRVGSQGLQGL